MRFLKRVFKPVVQAVTRKPLQTVLRAGLATATGGLSEAARLADKAGAVGPIVRAQTAITTGGLSEILGREKPFGVDTGGNPLNIVKGTQRVFTLPSPPELPEMPKMPEFPKMPEDLPKMPDEVKPKAPAPTPDHTPARPTPEDLEREEERRREAARRALDEAALEHRRRMVPESVLTSPLGLYVRAPVRRSVLG